MPEPTPTSTDAHDFLSALYAGCEEGWVSLFSANRTTGATATDWAPVADLGAVVAAAERRIATSCVWFGVATRAERLPDGRRGRKSDCALLPAMWVDIDVEGPNHANDNLPKTMAEAHALLERFPLPPSVVVDSGGGLQAWWLLDEPIEADPDEALLGRWGATWAQIASDAGVHVDNVFNTDRIMRLPGTVNRKAGATPVRIVSADYALRWGVDDLDGHLHDPPAPPQPSAERTVPYIGPERPGDAFNATVRDGSRLLVAAGFTLHHRDRNGDEHYTGPWKDTRQGASATVYAEDGHTTIWSETAQSRWPALKVRRPYDPFGLYVDLEHGGDFGAARRALSAKGYGSQPVSDLEGLIADAEPTPPQAADEPWPDPRPIPRAPAPPAWPREVLPAWMQAQVDNVTAQIGCDPLLPGMFGLGALAVAGLSHVRVLVRSGHTMWATLYLIAAGPPSSGKSPALDMMFEPVRQVERDRIASAAKDVAEADTLREILTKQAKDALDAAARTKEAGRRVEAAQLKAEAAMIVRPPEGRLITADVTPERLGTLMAANGERMAIVSDEAGILDIDRYGDKKRGANMDLYLQAHSGRPHVVDRATAPSISLTHPLLAIVAGVQPSKLVDTLTDAEFASRGLGARLMSATTAMQADSDDLERDVWDHDIAAAYDARLDELARQWASWGAPAILALSPTGRALYAEWRRSLRPRTTLGGDLEHEAGWVQKMIDSVMSAAALLHLADGHAHSEPIGPEVVGRAMRLGEWWIAHRTYERNPDADDAARVLRTLTTIDAERPGEVISRREIGRRGNRGLTRVEAFAPHLVALARLGWVRFVSPLADPLAGPPVGAVSAADGFILHPEAHRQGCPTASDNVRQNSTESSYPQGATTERQDLSDMSDVSVYRGPETSLSPLSSLDTETVPTRPTAPDESTPRPTPTAPLIDAATWLDGPFPDPDQEHA